MSNGKYKYNFKKRNLFNRYKKRLQNFSDIKILQEPKIVKVIIVTNFNI